ncbi:MAG: adenosylcobinamide-GDP ribazoletransferase [Anaerolineales bacterium]|nr:adenosylcobinamide-GDP ribazoletransferase [Anaerolineales bacterium]MCX7753671.1 adenosylcobinamide-GDP ribazoletransferase [Anaerolineales bacterium]MDW8279140.1 adenosylcobinamide-GDP ribazoletransferase [Anaerolineales bacterium]
MKSLRLAFSLLTTLPISAPHIWNPGDSGRAAGWFPLVGLVIGLLVGGVHWLGGLVFPPLVTGALALTAWVVLTGGLHLDGLADCADGLLYPGTPEKRLEIMRDPRLGAFGAIGLALALLLKFSVLASLTPSTLPAVLLAASLARWCILPAGLLPPAKPGGMGADFAAGLQKTALVGSGFIPLGMACLLGVRGLLAAALGLLAAFGVLTLAKNRLGGITGDVFGLLVESVETVVLLVSL